ncbi:hypothetical protein M0802_003359 [Mischocyttarus mexicanus]|nr:hypothetical protein M0802_003359 [Mischocyttarus mexicanus]
MVEREGQKVLDNGSLRSAARNPTRDDLCDLDNDYDDDYDDDNNNDDDDDDNNNDDDDDDGPAPPSHLIPLLHPAESFSQRHTRRILSGRRISGFEKYEILLVRMESLALDGCHHFNQYFRLTRGTLNMSVNQDERLKVDTSRGLRITHLLTYLFTYSYFIRHFVLFQINGLLTLRVR